MSLMDELDFEGRIEKKELLIILKKDATFPINVLIRFNELLWLYQNACFIVRQKQISEWFGKNRSIFVNRYDEILRLDEYKWDE